MVDNNIVKTKIKALSKSYHFNFSNVKYQVFENHILSFLERYHRQEELQFELTTDLYSQININYINQAEDYLKALLKELGEINQTPINSKEVFLVATHFANC
ncbi:PRD domain-containing protein [Spiroplasma sp. SV19]|uniref:PRD domain-containing protein n=1 Tax=Spiroplasma sp. SV19 TaxID=2570468 RepID=UPI0024B7D190|nr:PRD domain-containing protein [Spiroplasma sp. SV19]WHQ37445.1 PRD domain-containing protein [Spiroplasma sp. SV19]